jgi:hypothetical protein
VGQQDAGQHFIDKGERIIEDLLHGELLGHAGNRGGQALDAANTSVRIFFCKPASPSSES